MMKLHFLPNSQDATLRQRHWELFKYAETRAKDFSPHNRLKVKITHVYGGGSTWELKENTKGASYAKIHIPATQDDLGAVFHEVFHSAFHFSPLWKDKGNNNWGEAFCDAFRYIIEREKLSNTTFTCEMESWMGKLDGAVVGTRKKDLAVGKEDYKYKPYASRLLNKCDRNHYYTSFRQLWCKRNDNPSDPLDTYFNLS